MMLSKALINTLRIVVPPALFGVVLLIGILYISRQPVLYESQARVWIKPQYPSPFGGQQQSVYMPLMSFFNNPITTSAELVKSRVVLDEAVKLLHKRVPGARHVTAQQIAAELRVDTVKEADMLVIRIVDSNPEMAAAVCKAVLDGFVQLNQAHSTESASESRQFLEKQIQLAKQEFAEASARLKEYQQASGTLNIAQETDARITGRKGLEGRVSETKSNIARLQTRIGLLQNQLQGRAEGGDMVTKLTMISQDPIVKGLREKIASDEIRLVELRARLTPDHPRLGNLETSVARARKALDQRTQMLMASDRENLSGVDQQADSISQGLLETLYKAQADLKAEEQALASQLQELEAFALEMQEFPIRQERLMALERTQRLASDRLTDLEARLHTAKLIESVSSAVSNIEVVDYPQVPGAPFSPNVASAMSATVLFGVVIALASFGGLLLMDPSIGSLKEVLRVIPAPAFAGLTPVRMPPKDFDTMHRLRVGVRARLAEEQKLILVTSPDPGDGGGAVALGLAQSFARGGTRVALVDADLCSPSLHTPFNAPASPGLSSYLLNPSADLLPGVVRHAERNLDLIPAGAVAPDLLSQQSEAFRGLLELLRSEYDLVIVVTSCLRESTDYLSLVNGDTLSLVVVRIGHTLSRSVKLLAAQLQHLKTGKLVIVANNVDEGQLVSATVRAYEEGALEAGTGVESLT